MYSMNQSKTLKIYLFLLLIVLLVAGARIFTPPANFPADTVITVEEGSGLEELAQQLKGEEVIRSPFLFRSAAILMGGERGMKAGQYYLERPQSPILIAWRILHGKYDIETIRVTVPEGFTVRRISELFDENRFPFFDNEAFIETAQEGYLFPDTYFMPVTTTASSTIKIMRENFIRKIFPLMGQVEESGKKLEDIVTMASIIEAETNTQEGREIVSGILWRRIENGMPLQVDASFIYVNGKTTADLTLDDLKIDSPYNTYLYAGLPPGPIANPGLESIKAALNPQSSPYLYFLTGKDGEMYYSKTFEEHVANKQKYLR